MSRKEVYAKNSEKYVVTATADGHDYTLDYISKNPNQQSEGTSPTGLLLNALAGCKLMTARSYFSRKKMNVDDIEIKITGDFNYTNEGWKLKADAVLLVDTSLNSSQEKELIQFIERFCTVSGVLATGNEINLSIEYTS